MIADKIQHFGGALHSGQSRGLEEFRRNSIEEEYEFSGFFDDKEEAPLVNQRELREEYGSGVRAVLFGCRIRGIPYVTYALSVVQLVVFVYELVRSRVQTGSFIETHPFNPMIGPSYEFLINVGARYIPCMTEIDDITNVADLGWPCANTTSANQGDICTLQQLCGMSAMPEHDGYCVPNQWYRLITPIFLHAGIIHIASNMLMQVFLGSKIERWIGSVRYFVLYIVCGVSGFLLGANFSPAGMASTGASGALMGVIALNLLLFATTGDAKHFLGSLKVTRRMYWCMVFEMVIEVIVMVVLGLLPGLDNFSHVGGLCTGLFLGIVVLNDPVWTRDEQGQRRQRIFVAWCAARVVSFALVMAYFVLLIKNYVDNGGESPESCKWCKYINCLPVNGWCEQGEIITSTTSSSIFFTALAGVALYRYLLS